MGDVVEGKVTKIVAFGAFVEIYAGIEGLVHISELANRHVERPDEVVSVGQAVPVKVIEIDSDRRRLSLSIKRVAEGETPMQAGAMQPAEAEEAEEAEPAAAVEVEEASDEAIVAEEVAAEELAAEVIAAEGSSRPRSRRLPASV